MRWRTQPKQVLFICTGNYYRSRFAEALFNHLGQARGLRWRAFSRGLAIHLATGDLSPFALAELERRKIPLDRTAPTRMPLTQADLRAARRAIALREAEHRPMVQHCFPRWTRRIEYWDIGDVDDSTPEDTFAAIERQVTALIEDLEKPGPLRTALQKVLRRRRIPESRASLAAR
jgi:protein-tyrosine phosphatase